MFYQGSLLLSFLTCLVTGLPQPLNCAKLPGVPVISKIDVLPKIDPKDQDTKTGVVEALAGKTIPTNNITDSLPLPKGKLGVTENKPVLPNLGLPGVLGTFAGKTIPTINVTESIPLPKGYLGVTVNKPSLPNLGLPALQGGNKLLTINVTKNQPVPKLDVGVTVGKPILPNLGLPGLAAVPGLSTKMLDLNRRITRLEAVLKLEGRIQVVGQKIIATSAKEVDFATSIAKCKSVGGNVATPMNEAENNAILVFVKQYNRYAYLGIREGLVPNIYHYLNGSPALYTHWRKNEPSGKGNESCVEMYTDGTWNNKACNQKRLTVCEF